MLYQPYLEITPQTGEQITQQVVEQKENTITPQLLQQIAAKLFCALGASYAAMMVWLTYGFLAFVPNCVKFELKMEGVTVFATPNALSLHHETIHGDIIFEESAERFGNIK